MQKKNEVASSDPHGPHILESRSDIYRNCHSRPLHTQKEMKLPTQNKTPTDDLPEVLSVLPQPKRYSFAPVTPTLLAAASSAASSAQLIGCRSKLLIGCCQSP